jgi:hypothetical protein
MVSVPNRIDAMWRRLHGEPLLSQFLCKSHRIHRAAAGLAANENDGARVLGLKTVARDAAPRRDSRAWW